MTSRMILLIVALVLPGLASAFSYDENIDGDLSGDRFNPTDLGVAALGSNLLSATSVANDLEYFTFNVVAGQQLDAIELLSWNSTDDVSFAAIQAGTVFTEPAAGTDVSNLLGWHHFGLPDLGTDFLDDMGSAFGVIGFTAPLSAGDYVFWFQETGPNPAAYSVDFKTSVVPVPAAVWLFVSALGVLGWRKRRVHRQLG
ncbi:MAG: hypothetical protein ACR2QG_06270 [Gammaproteobacteria bacterium]